MVVMLQHLLLLLLVVCAAAEAAAAAAKTEAKFPEVRENDRYLTRGADVFSRGPRAVADWRLLPKSFSQAPPVQATAGVGPAAESVILAPDGTLWSLRVAPTTMSLRRDGAETAAERPAGQRQLALAQVDVRGSSAAVMALKLRGTVLRRPSSGFASTSSASTSTPSTSSASTSASAFASSWCPLAFANAEGVFLCNATASTSTSSSSSAAGYSLHCLRAAGALWNRDEQVRDLTVTMLGDVWIATDGGLFYLPSGWPGQHPLQRIAEVSTPCTAVAFDDASGSIAAGKDVLWRRVQDAESPTGATWHYFRTPGIIDANVTALEFDADGVLWVANSICVNKQHSDLGFERVGGLDGLVRGNLTSLSLAPSGAMWLGSLYGAMRFLPEARRSPLDFEDATWQYFYGPRWLPGPKFQTDAQSVPTLGVAAWLDGGANGAEGAVVLTAGGFSAIQYFETSLTEKAAHYQEVARLRHFRPPGFCSDVGLRSFGNVSSFYYHSSDNDGLWTSIYTASQCFRYALTKDPQVKAEAWKRFEALEFLNHVTGIPGLMARSALHAANPPPHTGGVWHNSTTYPGWIWKGDTSSDEVTGHLFIYPLVHDLLAETPEEKARALKLIYDITHYIQENDWYLIDITGKPTTWGKWNPKWLNGVQSWYDERGLGALQILSWLLSAHRLTGDQYFMDGFRELVDKHGYGTNIINQKITEPDDDNFSDDELAYLPYYTWIHTKSPMLRTQFAASLRRAHRINKPERSDLWDTIFAAFEGKMGEEERSDVLWTLRDWTWSLVDWPTDNSEREDIWFNPNEDRSNHHHTQTMRVLPYKERTMLRWNSNPYHVSGGSGFSECDPGAWLLPYWMARYHGFI